jgi:hypothetical protein
VERDHLEFDSGGAETIHAGLIDGGLRLGLFRRCGVVWGGIGRAWTWQGRGLGNGRAEGLQREGKHSAVMRKARMYMCAMQALCGTTLPSASGRSAFCVAAGFKDAPNRFC